jgi:hypothetical protein|nr:hypothetical protein [uncultured Bradyrhizobium sp.]
MGGIFPDSAGTAAKANDAELGSVAALLRDSLREVLNHLDAAHQRLDASICRDCMFLAERSPATGKGRATAEFMCRLYRAPVSLEETELLCTSFERTRDRPKIEDHFDRARVASQG